MALNIENEYLNSIAADADYPEGSFKNATNPLALDGTPFEKEWPNDVYGILQSLLLAAGISASGSADTVQVSQYFDALQAIFQSDMWYNDVSVAANTVLLEKATGNPLLSLMDNQLFLFKASEASTGASTLDVDGIGAKPLVRDDGVSFNINTMVNGVIYQVRYDLGADNFKLQTSTFLKIYNTGNSGIGILRYDSGTSRVLTIPDPGADAALVATEGTQTINGAKVFPTNTEFKSIGSSSAPYTAGTRLAAVNNANIGDDVYIALIARANNLAGFNFGDSGDDSIVSFVCDLGSANIQSSAPIRLPSSDPVPNANDATREGISKAHGSIDGLGGIIESFNVSSVVHVGVGINTVNFDRDFSTFDPVVVVTANETNSEVVCTASDPDNLFVDVRTFIAGVLANQSFTFSAFGDQ